MKPPKETFLSPRKTTNGVDSSKMDKVLGIDKILNFSGDTTAFLYNGAMVVTVSGKNLVLIDVSSPSQALLKKSGLWKAFKPGGSSLASPTNGSFAISSPAGTHSLNNRIRK